MGLSSREGRRRVLVLMAARLCRLGGGESDVQGGRGGGEEEMRIADVLCEREEEAARSGSNQESSDGNRGRGGGGQGRRRKGSSPSPRCLLSRWLPSKPRCRGGEEEVVRGEVGAEIGEVSGVASLGPTSGVGRRVPADREEEEDVQMLEAMGLGSEGGDGAVGSEEGSMQGSVWKPEQTYLNIGMGAGLVLMLTRSVTEFNKMTELRSEMEILLKEIKDVLQKKDAGPNCADPKNNLACCSSDSCGNMEWCNDLFVQDCTHDPCLELAKGSYSAELDGHSVCNKTCQENKSFRIDQMEEELKSELELLQLNLDTQESSELTVELPCEKSDASECFNVSVGEHPEPKEQAEEYEEDTRDRYGVCPQELMSRLHELLEAQQQERIAQLESALEVAHTKLRQKEMEASWWRDTARLVSQHKQETLLR